MARRSIARVLVAPCASQDWPCLARYTLSVGERPLALLLSTVFFVVHINRSLLLNVRVFGERTRTTS